MADKFDVAGRLADARPSVDNTQSYVWACHLVGYQNPDLTTHSAQIRDWFSSEDGMDLHGLDADCAAVHAAAAAADDALAQQRDQLARLAAAWQGDGAMSAHDFVRRHCETAENLTTSVREAADALAGLRDTLWQMVDTKAAAVTGIDDRRQAERASWLAAAHTVTTNVGDRAAASELVDQQVKPYVDNDIRVEWLTAVRNAITSIGSSYDAVTSGLMSGPHAQFEVPGDFGAAQPNNDDDAGAHAHEPASTTTASSAPPAPPAAAPAPTPALAAPYPSAGISMPPATTANPPAAEPISPTAGLPSPIGGAPAMPASLGQLEGLPQRFADALSGLSSTAGNPVADPLDPPAAGDDVPADGSTSAEREPDNDETDCDAGEHERSEKPDTSTNVDDAAADEPAPTPSEPPPSEPPTPPPSPSPEPPAPPPPEPPPAEPPTGEAATPCEIAASELPQAGQ